MRWYMSAVFAWAAHVSARSRPAERLCHPLVTISSTATVIKTPAAVTTTVKTTETFYTRITRYRAGHTLSILVNATSTVLHTCTPASRLHVGLERRDGTDDAASSTIAAEATTVAAEAPYLNMSTVLWASAADTENTLSYPLTTATGERSASTASTQSSSIETITSHVSGHKTHSGSTANRTVHEITEIVTVSRFRNVPLRTSSYRPETRPRLSKPTKTQPQDQSLHHGYGRSQTETHPTRTRGHSKDSGRRTTEVVVAPHSTMPSPHRASPTRGQKGYEIIEYDIFVEEGTLTKQHSRKARLTPFVLPVSTRTVAHPRKCDPTFTARYTTVSTASRPTITKMVTYVKLKTSTVKATKAASTKKVTKTSVVATSSATVIAGQNGRYTARSGAKAIFNIYKNVGFPEGSLADCVCDGRTSCSSIGQGKLCDSLETCMDLCAGWNNDPKGPLCVGVSFARSKLHSEATKAPWCHLKWIVPPHSIPPQNATCGLVMEDVDSAVLHRQTFN